MQHAHTVQQLEERKQAVIRQAAQYKQQGNTKAYKSTMAMVTRLNSNITWRQMRIACGLD